MLTATAQRALEAYGGADLWRRATTIEIELSAKGLAFVLKRRPYFDHVLLRLRVDLPWASITPIAPGGAEPLTGVLDGHDVRLERADGSVAAERKNARTYFPYGRRLFRWDALDMTYFANYASWNYFTLPHLLLNETIRWTEPRDGVLTAVFPADIPTHSVKQEFFFDTTTGLLRQHNYTADIISGLATAANTVLAHADFDGLPVTVSRLVTPMRKDRSAMKGPVLIDLRVHRYRLSTEARA